MAANRKVNNTTTRSPSWRPIEKLITLPHDRHHGAITYHTIAIMAANRKVNNTTTRSPSWRPIEKLITLPHDRHHGGQ